MSRNRLCSAIVLAAGLLLAAPVVGSVAQVELAPSAWANGKKKQKQVRRGERRYAVERGSTPEEIARYFQLYGGFIDPAINRQTPGGPFDSGFFFDSGIGPNGGNSPYMN